jgi:hypothetical protein
MQGARPVAHPCCVVRTSAATTWAPRAANTRRLQSGPAAFTRDHTNTNRGGYHCDMPQVRSSASPTALGGREGLPLSRRPRRCTPPASPSSGRTGRSPGLQRTSKPRSPAWCRQRLLRNRVQPAADTSTPAHPHTPTPAHPHTGQRSTWTLRAPHFSRLAGSIVTDPGVLIGLRSD